MNPRNDVGARYGRRKACSQLCSQLLAARLARNAGSGSTSLPAPAIPRLRVEDFAREPDTSRARLSPDGKFLAFVRNFNGTPQLHVAEIDSKKLSRLDLGEATVVNDAPKEVGPFDWVSGH